MCKIADFGLARKCSEDENGQTIYVACTSHAMAWKWSPPEGPFSNSDEIRTFSETYDVWSYGILLWEILTFGAEPYEGLGKEHIKEIARGAQLSIPSIAPEKMKELMRECWKLDPNFRPRFQQITSTLHGILTRRQSRFLSIQSLSDDSGLTLSGSSSSDNSSDRYISTFPNNIVYTTQTERVELLSGHGEDSENSVEGVRYVDSIV